MGNLRWMRLFVAVLILPAVIVLGIATFETRIFYPLPSNGPTRGIVWDGRTFATRTDFARWLRSRGVPYRVWARRHPVLAGLTPSRSAQQAARLKAGARNKRQTGSGWGLLGLGGGAAVLAVLSLGIVSVRRRRRPGSGGSARQSLDVAVRRGATVAERGARLTRRWATVTAQRSLTLATTATSSPRRRSELAWYLTTALFAAGIGLIVAVWLNGA